MTKEDKERIEKTLYEMWLDQNVPVKLHEATVLIFQAYKLGTSGHVTPLRNAFPEYFTEPWIIGINLKKPILSKI